MSTMREQFEAWAKIPIWWRNGETYDDLHTAQAWAAWQAATEAAKATGTAGLQEHEILSLAKKYGFTTTQILSRGPELIGGSVELHERFMKFGQACAEAALAKVYAIAVEEKAKMDAEAARQPAPVVAVKTWQERQQEHFAAEMFSMKDDADFMELEIAELRAAIAATNRSQP